MKILLPVDGSDHTKRMLGYIAAHGELLGAGHEYLAFTAVVPLPSHASRFVDQATLDGWHAEQAELVFKPIRAFAKQQQWNFRAVYRCGHAAEAIAAFAEVERPDLILMGTHGTSAFVNVVLGSVATGVLARCRFPVLLVR